VPRRGVPKLSRRHGSCKLGRPTVSRRRSEGAGPGHPGCIQPVADPGHGQALRACLAVLVRALLLGELEEGLGAGQVVKQFPENELWHPEVFEGDQGLFSWGPPLPPSFVEPEDLAGLMTGQHSLR
jgi:hypothetical protein